MRHIAVEAWHQRRLAASVSAVVRLRFVQEYRGRRIVTDGKLYGIEGQLITDCRYLNVLGARAAINSEAGIEERRKSRNPARGTGA
jgi:hypothetical protein